MFIEKAFDRPEDYISFEWQCETIDSCDPSPSCVNANECNITVYEDVANDHSSMHDSSSVQRFCKENECSSSKCPETNSDQPIISCEEKYKILRLCGVRNHIMFS